MNTDDRRKELENRHAEEKRRLERELEMLAAIPESLAHLEWAVHPSKLYDRAGSLHAKKARQYYSSEPKHRNPTITDAVDVYRAFPGVPIVLFRDGSVGIRSRAEIDAMAALPDDDPKRQPYDRAVISVIAPFWLAIDPSSYSQELEIGWIATVAGKLCDVKIEFSTYGPELRAIGNLTVRYEHDRRHENVIGVLENRFAIDRRLEVLGNCIARQIRYGSGDHRVPGRHLVYWDCGSVDDPTADFAEFAGRVLEIMGEQEQR